jgi:hypothetical protein
MELGLGLMRTLVSFSNVLARSPILDGIAGVLYKPDWPALLVLRARVWWRLSAIYRRREVTGVFKNINFNAFN